MNGFAISDMRLGSGVIGLGPLPGGQHGLARDIATLAKWKPDAVLSLTPMVEMTTLGAGDLPGLLGAAGICWLHFPVADFGVPSPDQDTDWAALSESLMRLLGRGGRLMVHCRGGCGRTGMVVLRLMVEAGEDPIAALQRLRSVRPCAVETDAQREWASMVST